MRTFAVLVALFLIFSSSQSYGKEQYTIVNIFSIALKKAEKVRIAEENLVLSKEDENKAFAILIPSINAFGKHTEYAKDKIVNNQIVQPDRSTAWGLTIEERLSLGGREFIGLSMAKDNTKKTQYEVDSFKEHYLLKVANSFYGYLKAKRAVEIAETNVERLKKHRDAARIRLKVGEVTKTDVLRAEAELSGAEAELIGAKNSLRVAKSQLAKEAGIEGDFEIVESKIFDPYLNLTLDHLKSMAKEERPEIKSSMIYKEIAKKGVNYSISAYFPNLSLTATYQRLDQDPSNQFTNKETKSIVAALNFTIFDGGLRKAEVSQAKARLRQAELQYEDTIKEIFIELESAYSSYLTFRDTIKSLEDEVTFARENFNSVSKQYQHGLANSIDVTDANSFLLTAERKLMDARYNYELAILRLRHATGTLIKALLNNEIIGGVQK